MLRKTSLFALFLLLCQLGTLQQRQFAAGQQVAPESEPPDPQPTTDPADPDLQNPFPRRFDLPDFLKDAEWINTGGPLRASDLKGKFVLLDFWTYCCINCIHILPELKKLEHAYRNELVVIGVHSAKFETEQDTKNISEAVLRYEIEHPVINDSNHRLWQMFGVSSWPTILLIDPEGKAVYGRSGEFKFEDMDPVLKQGVEYYRAQGLIDDTRLRFDLLAHRQQPTELKFPGKVLADASTNRLYVTDSNHNRIVVSTLDGVVQEIIGSGLIGSSDGGFADATFDHPQGVALHNNVLYVADTENHLLRKVDLVKKTVQTIAGTGEQARQGWPGLDNVRGLPDRFVGPPKTTALSSPWALWVHADALYIAMAGPHQIWKMPLDESEIGPYAGNGREDIVDGPLLPAIPYAEGFASFAQPSGLTSDGEWLYVADSEGSSIRAVPFDASEEVWTVVGSNALLRGRLFAFGDADGRRDRAKLQHALGVAYRDGKIYVADTYNNKIKVVDAKSGYTRTLAGTRVPGFSDSPAKFDEPAGISIAGDTLFVADTNNHAIRKVDFKTGATTTLKFTGLTAPARPRAEPDLALAEGQLLERAALKSVEGRVTFQVKLQYPEGWKTNDLAPMSYTVSAAGEQGVIDRTKLGRVRVKPPAESFEFTLPITGDGEDTITLAVNYYYCRGGSEGLCKVGKVAWTIPLAIRPDAAETSLTLNHVVK